MYQGASDDFLGPHDEVPLPDEALGIDFEGEFGVVVDRVPVAVTPDELGDACRAYAQPGRGDDRRFGHRVECGPRRGLGLYRRASRHRDHRSR